MQLNMEQMFLTQWESFPASIAYEGGAKLFVQSFLGPFDGLRGLRENVKVCLRSCMLHSIPPPPQGVIRLEASLRENLALCSCSKLIVVVMDLARCNAYLGEDVQVNRPVVIESLITRLAEVTSIMPCPQCWYPHTKC